MKKTLQSTLTAALFAAAITSGTGGTLSPQLANAVDDITTVPETTYGPPGWMMTTEEPEDTGTTPLITAGTIPIYTEDTTTTTTTTSDPEDEPVMLSGDVPVYNEPGDLDRNGSFDARDLTLLKRRLMYQDGTLFQDIYDVNGDGQMNSEDARALVRLLTGKPEEEEDPASTSVSSSTTSQLTSTTTEITSLKTQPAYGPPLAWL